MASWQPKRAAVLAALADEILHNYRAGWIAVDGDATTGSTAFADGLADALRASGLTVMRVDDCDSADQAPLTTDLGVIAGDQLQRPARAGQWTFAVWLQGSGEDSAAAQLYLRQVAPRAKASAIIDNRDPEHPRRQFADSC